MPWRSGSPQGVRGAVHLAASRGVVGRCWAEGIAAITIAAAAVTVIETRRRRWVAISVLDSRLRLRVRWRATTGRTPAASPAGATAGTAAAEACLEQVRERVDVAQFAVLDPEEMGIRRAAAAVGAAGAEGAVDHDRPHRLVDDEAAVGDVHAARHADIAAVHRRTVARVC